MLDTHPARRHLERKSSKTHEDPSMKPTIAMLTPTAKQDPHPTTLETDNAQAGIVIGRASPHDSAGTQIITRRAGRAGRRSRLPLRASAGEPPTTHGGARRPDPGGGRLAPEIFAGAGTPGGEQDPGALQGARTSTLRIREAGTSAQGAEGRPKTARRGAAWR